jgi:hypothetical protein
LLHWKRIGHRRARYLTLINRGSLDQPEVKAAMTSSIMRSSCPL